jgi:hypothetical protein
VARLSLEEAINDKILLKPYFETLSKTQRVIVKAVYGLPLNEEELIMWSLLQEHGEHDDLGYPTKVSLVDYTPKEYKDLVLVAGRRSGKTSKVGSFILAYEAICGGHREFASKNQIVLYYNISQQLEIAKANMGFIRDVLESTPFLEDQVEHFGVEKYILKDGSVIAPSSPSLRKQRGLAIPCFLADEVGFWSLDAESANPDVEVERSLAPTMLQFPHGKKLWCSSPYVKYGILYDYYMAGTDGNKLLATSPEKPKYTDTLVCWSPTAMSGVPLYGRKDLEKEKAKDPKNFDREYLCKFVDSISGFLNTELVDFAFSKARGVIERPNANNDPRKLTTYTHIAAIDPAFRRDNFAFVIVHRDENNCIVLDKVQRWSPSAWQKIDPQSVMTQVANTCQEYGIRMVYTDQYQFEALNQIALNVGIGLQPTMFDNKGKNKIFGTLEQVINQRKLILLDDSLNQDAKALRRELLQLEKKLLASGRISIEAPPHLHDDLAFSLALAVHHAVSVSPVTKAQVKRELNFEVDHVKMVLDQERRNRVTQGMQNDYIYR